LRDAHTTSASLTWSLENLALGVARSLSAAVVLPRWHADTSNTIAVIVGCRLLSW
jgi:hypothetical protein